MKTTEVTTGRKLAFIFLYGLIGIPCHALGWIYHAIHMGWCNGRMDAQALFDEVLDRNETKAQ
jgi:hypothetical protein